jgi:hypothetical protein
MKPKVADHPFVLGGNLAGRGVVLMPVCALRTYPPERERQQRESNPLAAHSEVLDPRWPTGAKDGAPEAFNSSLEGT